MQSFTVKRDSEPDITFKGDLIAEVHTDSKKDRWTRLAIYKTEDLFFVCELVEISNKKGERTKYSARVCKAQDEAVTFFKPGRLSKELFTKAGISVTITAQEELDKQKEKATEEKERRRTENEMRSKGLIQVSAWIPKTRKEEYDSFIADLNESTNQDSTT